METFGADRRFALYLACALAAIALLSVAPEFRGSSLDSAPRSEFASPAPASQAEPLERILQQLLTSNPISRFSQFQLSVISETTILEGSQVISYYGNGQAAEMGILGSDDLDTIASLLEEQTERYDRLNGQLGAVPALHLVYAVAQPEPTSNGLYLQYTSDEDVQRYIDVAEERGMLLFIDLQIGRSTVEEEVTKVLPYLRHPLVHLAIDPEFAVGDTEVPGLQLGSLPASDINRAQAMLNKLVQEERLPPKMLIVHQFADSMLLDAESIVQYEGVELIIDMDGFGLSAVKRAGYELYAGSSYATYGAIKLFLQHDVDLMSEEEVLRLQPTPAVVIYQ